MTPEREKEFFRETLKEFYRRGYYSATNKEWVDSLYEVAKKCYPTTYRYTHNSFECIQILKEKHREELNVEKRKLLEKIQRIDFILEKI